MKLMRCNETILPEVAGPFVQCTKDIMHEGRHESAIDVSSTTVARYYWPQMDDANSDTLIVQRVVKGESAY